MGCLFSWNAFITVTAYFAVQVRGSNFESNFESYFGFTFQAVNIMMLVLANRVQSRIPLKYRILPPMVIQFVAFIGITAMVKIDFQSDPNVFFFATLALVVVSAACTSFFQGGLFGLTAMMPFTYTQALMGGQGLGGVTVSLLNVVTLAGFQHASDIQGPKDAAFIFFLVSLLVGLATIVSFVLLLKLPVVKYHMNKVAIQVRLSSAEIESSIQNNTEGKCNPKGRPWSNVLSSAMQVGYVFFITLAVFPAIAANIQSEHFNATANATNATPAEKYAKTFFVPIFCFLLFNVGDLAGRTLAGMVKWPSFENRKYMWVPVLARTAFIPLFLLCNIKLGGGADNFINGGVPLFTSDWVPYLLMALMGISNGYYSTLLMMYGPGTVPVEDVEWAGGTMLLFLVLGLTCGTFFSFPLRAIICHCNPFVAGNSTNQTPPNSTFPADGPWPGLMGLGLDGFGPTNHVAY